MSSNYEWQKQYTQQRISDAHRQASQHRAARSARPEATRRQGPLAMLRAWLQSLLRRQDRNVGAQLPTARTGLASSRSKEIR